MPTCEIGEENKTQKIGIYIFFVSGMKINPCLCHSLNVRIDSETSKTPQRCIFKIPIFGKYC